MPTLGELAGARIDGRKPDQLRTVTIERNYTKYAEGSCLITMGETRVLCTASVEDRVPQWMRGAGGGWVTAEYGMLPRSTAQRTPREAARGRIGGRTHEIQRLIGRSLRAVVDLKAIGERTIWLDCDVIQADGGTRTASITGAFVALADALARLASEQKWERLPIFDYVAAVSVGVVDGRPVLDLNYEEDSRAEVDMNVVRTGRGRFIEVQGTAEGEPFEESTLSTLLDLAGRGIRQLVTAQRKALEPAVAAAIDAAAKGEAGRSRARTRSGFEE